MFMFRDKSVFNNTTTSFTFTIEAFDIYLGDTNSWQFLPHR